MNRVSCGQLPLHNPQENIWGTTKLERAGETPDHARHFAPAPLRCQRRTERAHIDRVLKMGRRQRRAFSGAVEQLQRDLHHRVGELFKLSAVLVRLHRRLAFRPGATGIATSRTTPRVALCPAR